MTVLFSESFLTHSPLDESLILGLQYNELERQVVLIYDYAAENVSRYFAGLNSKFNVTNADNAFRCFRRITFENVSQMKVFNDRKSAEVKLETLGREIASRPIIVLQAKLTQKNDQRTLCFVVSGNLEISINFGHATVDQRTCRAEAISNGAWKYFDSDTDEVVDFFHPFD